MGKLDGQVAFITGGAKGQGRSHAVTLAKEGADIVLFDNCITEVPGQGYPGGSNALLEETHGLVEAAGRRCLSIVGDVRNSEDLDHAVKESIAAFGQIDILLCNAGVMLQYLKMADIPPEQWADTVDVNLTGVYNSMRAVLPHMVARRSGKIVATSSTAGRRGGANIAAYVASKWGVIGLVKSVASDYGEYGIRVNAVCPTNVNSQMLHNKGTYGIFCPDIENPTREQAEERMRVAHPLRVPYVEAQDISNAILFLVSDDARYVTAEVFHVSAGLMATNIA